MPLHVAQVSCDNRGPEGAADERARKSASTAGEGRHRPKALVPEVGGGTELCCETVDAGGGNGPGPQVTQSDGSHAKNHREQQGRDSMHHSTTRGCLVRGRDRVGRRRERRDAQSRRIWVRELKRESRVRARAGKSGSGQETWAKTSVDQSRARGKEGRWAELGDREAW